MRIALINGSPKVNNSTSGILLEDLKLCLSETLEIKEYGFHKSQISADIMNELQEADVYVFAFPLYVDAIPSHMLSCLCQLEQAAFTNKNIRVYGIVNCGFYEGIQNETALEVLQNWCHKASFQWGYGLGVGGGGALATMNSIPFGKGPKKPIDDALMQMAERINNTQTTENQYVSIGFPRTLYKMAAEAGWKQMIKANGKKVRDLDKQF